MPYGIGYTRFSSAKQRKGSSQDRQLHLIAEWFKENPQYKPYPKTFNDLGKSGFTGAHLKEHGGLGQLVATIKAGHINKGDIILVEAIDRLGRLPELEMLNLITEILKSGVNIITLEDGKEYKYDTGGPSIYTLLGQIEQAHSYSSRLADRIAASYKNREIKASKGESIRRRTPIWLNSDGSLKLDISDAMRTAFEDSAAGFGERRILRRLSERNPIFREYNPSTVTRWLTNDTAIGYWRGNKIYPAIVSDELFYQVQKSIKSRHRPGNAPTKHPISGLIKCGHCGSNLQVKTNKNSPDQMVCSGYHKSKIDGCTNNKHFPAHILQKIVDDTCTSAVQNGIKKDQLTKAEKENIRINRLIDEITRNINAIMEIPDFAFIPEYKEKISTLAKNRNELENQKIQVEILNPTEEQSPYEAAWDVQYDLLKNDPMLLNARLQSVNYHLLCFIDGTIQSSTTGNELSVCQYVKYERNMETYLLRTPHGEHRIIHPKNALKGTQELSRRLDRIRFTNGISQHETDDSRETKKHNQPYYQQDLLAIRHNNTKL